MVLRLMARYALSLGRLGRIVVWDSVDGFPLKIERLDGGANAFASKSLIADALGRFSATTSSGGGDVNGPATANDNRIARFDGTTGKLIQNSGASIDDSGNITGNNLSGTNTGDQTNISGNAATVTTNANLTGPITSVGNATSIASQTGTGTKFVVDTSPALVTPDIGAATGTSLTTTGTVTAGTGAAAANVQANASAATNAAYRWYNGAVAANAGLYWQAISAGTTFAWTLSRYIAGAFQDSPISVANATGIATFTASPIVPTPTAGDNSTKTATTAYVRTAISVSRYENLLQVGASHTAGAVAGTYGLGFGNVAAVSGTGTLYQLGILHYVAADYPTTIDGLSPKLRIRAQVNCNDVAPTGNFTFGMYPITRPATSGGAGLCIYTIGTVVSGSNGSTVSTPAADSQNSLVGSDFTPPADGQYIIAVVTTATVAASAHVHLNAILQMHYA
jgi:hypothetical protein